jgi:hypothetical protein
MRRWHGLTVAVVALSTIPMASAAASDGSLHDYTSQTNGPIELLGTDPSGAPRPELCDSEAGRCIVGYIGREQSSGALNGSMIGAGSISVGFATGQGDGTGFAKFTGSVAGCPDAGTVTFRVTTQLGTKPGQNTGQFEVVNDTGTRGLSQLRGHGDFVATLDPTTGNYTTRGTTKLRCL